MECLPVDPRKTTELLGIDVFEYDFFVESGYKEWGTMVYGMHKAYGDGTRLIHINTYFPEDEIRFTYGHELGHAAYGHGHTSEELALCTFPEEEALADRFATILLAPRRYVREAVRELGTDSIKLAEVFGIPERYMKIRLQDLGLLQTQEVAA
jgi:Zn-dependent peptidase ImmA (M78 family)